MKNKKRIPKPENTVLFKRVKRFLDAIDWMFGINGYTKSVLIKEKNVEVAEGNKKVAEIFCDREYQDVEVRIFPVFKTYSLDRQRKILLHELCHSITVESRAAMTGALDGKLTHQNQINYINEEETSKIENIIDRLLRGNLQYAKKAYREYLK
jgi:hypothetical protein